MLRSRIIPCLLIHNGGLVKTESFSNTKYIGDPINAVRIFNEKEADELIVIDIDATVKNQEPNYALIEKLAAECRMPFCYGGGIKTEEQASKIINLGVEKIAVSSLAIESPNILTSIAKKIGNQSLVIVIDIVKVKSMFGLKYQISTHNNTKNYKLDPIEFVQSLQKIGIGEIVLNFVSLDGKMIGYDLSYVKKISKFIKVPLTILGGAGSLNDIKELVKQSGIIGAAAGSLFVFKGKFKAVLISYPNELQKKSVFQDNKNSI